MSDDHLQRILARLDGLETLIDSRFEQVEGRLGGVESEVRSLSESVMKLEALPALVQEIDERTTRIETYLNGTI